MTLAYGAGTKRLPRHQTAGVILRILYLTNINFASLPEPQILASRIRGSKADDARHSSDRECLASAPFLLSSDQQRYPRHHILESRPATMMDGASGAVNNELTTTVVRNANG